MERKTPANHTSVDQFQNAIFPTHSTNCLRTVTQTRDEGVILTWNRNKQKTLYIFNIILHDVG